MRVVVGEAGAETFVPLEGVTSIVVKDGCGRIIAEYTEAPEPEVLDQPEWDWLELREPRPIETQVIPVGQVEGLDESVPTDS